jgi:hypothetical protein
MNEAQERARLAELYPEGRTLFYEGRDPKGFLDYCEEQGVEPTIQVQVPVDLLFEFTYDQPMGS